MVKCEQTYPATESLVKSQWNIFQNLLSDYRKNKSAYTRRKIRTRLSTKTAFAAFKRDYIREYQSEYKEFQEMVS